VRAYLRLLGVYTESVVLNAIATRDGVHHCTVYAFHYLMTS
jgi:hypothetical protein